MRPFTRWIVLVVILIAVGFAVGYALSSTWGRDRVRAEVEQILSDLMEGPVEVDEVRFVLTPGLGMHGRGLRAYPTPEGPGLEAQAAYIELRETALLVGDVLLAELVLEDVALRIRHEADGSFSFPPLQSLRNGAAGADDADDDPVLEVFEAAEEVARVLLEEVHIADRIVVQRGSVVLEDRDVGPDTAPQRFALEDLEGMLTRSWLYGDGQLALVATFVDPLGHRTAARATAFVRDGDVSVSLAAPAFELDGIRPYLQRLDAGVGISGRLGGELRLRSPQPGLQDVVADLALEDVTPSLALTDERFDVALTSSRLEARLEVTPGVARLVESRVSGRRVALHATASLVRPVSRNAPLRVEARLTGLTLADLDRLAERLPEADARFYRDLFGRVESAKVDHLSLGGRTTLGTWGELLTGEHASPIDGFLVRLGVSDLSIALDADDRLTDAAFEADWAADRLEVRRGRGQWQGTDLPDLEVSIDGVSRFAGMKAVDRSVNAEPLPGLPLAWELLIEGPEDDEEEPTSEDRFRVEVDYLDHPILRWPIESATLTVKPIPHGTEALVTQGTWGGFPVQAEIVSVLHPEPRITVAVRALEGMPASERTSSVARPPDGGPWGRGRFALEPASGEEAAPSPLSRMSGAFLLTGSSIRLSGVEATVSETARVVADATVDLGQAESLPVDFQGRIEGADLEDLGRTMGLSEGLITGTVDLEADLHGSLARERLFAGLDGTIHGRAVDGKIRQNVPLAVALATATDGFNPFARRDRLQYESIETNLVLQGGRLRAERFELEGPVRVYASGNIDFAEPNQPIDAVVGVFLFQRVRELLGKVPLVNLVLPGSEKGWVGSYYRVSGPWSEPVVTAMPLKSLTEGVPDIITRPFEILNSLWRSSRTNGAAAPPDSTQP